MKRFEGILICSDYDGTLAYNRQVSRENLDAIRYFQENGGLFTMATGRTGRYVFASDFGFSPNAPVIACNGTEVYDNITRKPLFSCPMVPAYQDVVRFCLSHVGLIGGTFYCLVGGDVETEVPNHLVECLMLTPAHKENCLKVVFRMKEPAATLLLQKDALLRYRDTFRFERSWDTGLEMLNIHAGKGLMLQKVRQTLGSRVQKVIGIGDQQNDLTLFTYADEGIAVANAIPEVLAAADRVTVSVTENAIAKIIYEL